MDEMAVLKSKMPTQVWQVHINIISIIMTTPSHPHHPHHHNQVVIKTEICAPYIPATTHGRQKSPENIIFRNIISHDRRHHHHYDDYQDIDPFLVV